MHRLQHSPIADPRIVVERVVLALAALAGCLGALAIGKTLEAGGQPFAVAAPAAAKQSEPAPATCALPVGAGGVGQRETIRRFVATAVARERVAASFPLTSRALRSGMTCGDWSSGTIPIQPFRQIDWQRYAATAVPAASTPGRAAWRVSLVSSDPMWGESSFDAVLVREDGHWVVDYFMPAPVLAAQSPSD